MFHFNFRAGDDIFRESVSSVGSVRRLRERDSRVYNSRVLRAREHTAGVLWESRANRGDKLAGDGEDDGACTQRLRLPFYFGCDFNSRIYLFDTQSARFGQYFNLGSGGLWNAVDAIGQVLLAADEQVPEHLHQNYARRGISGSPNGTVQARKKDALEDFFCTNPLEIRPRIFSIERTCKIAATVDERAMMAQQVESKSRAREARTQRNCAIKEQVIKSSRSVPAATGGVLNPDAEFSFAHEWRKIQALHKSAHRTKGIAEERHAAVDHKAVDAIRRHTAADARFRLQHQRVEAAVLQPESRSNSRDPSANHDYVGVSALGRHEDSP